VSVFALILGESNNFIEGFICFISPCAGAPFCGTSAGSDADAAAAALRDESTKGKGYPI
jgi:hypothetical protein